MAAEDVHKITFQASRSSMVYAFCSYTKGGSTMQNKPSIKTHDIFAHSCVCLCVRFASCLCFALIAFHSLYVTCSKHIVPLGPIMGRGLK
jgi:hypothetical protein